MQLLSSLSDSDPLLTLKTFVFLVFIFMLYFTDTIFNLSIILCRSDSLPASIGHTANLKALMTKKVSKKILRIKQNFFVNLRKICFWPLAPPPFFWARRRTAADRNWPARHRRHNDVGAQLYA